ncbi:F-box/LRR-repeat protein 6 isoform X2 [Tiliqua scincoides]|uniref:F-box/LRR-repeat protein 6 isoform X2 n=1 Tax=Tiliqua scincoides TaxID=71010 RepID=UPI0034637CF0
MDERPRGSGYSAEVPLPATRPRAPWKRGAAVSSTPGPASPAPKKKTRKAPRRAAPQYLVHETDNDMLLIISNVDEARGRLPRRALKKRRKQQQKGPKKKAASRRRRGKGDTLAEGQTGTARVLDEGSQAFPPSTNLTAGSSWGTCLPVEILVHIFQHAVALQGSVPFLCRMACVCRLWNVAASSPVLWQKVSIGYCWVAPGQKQSLVMEKRVCGTVEWLVSNRFSHLRDFTLSHWKSHVPFVLMAIGRSCPRLVSLKLSHCSKVTTESLSVLAECCSQLESLNLQNSQSSCCPSLQLLEVNTEIKQSSQHFQLPIEQLQAACPHLQVLRLLNVVWCPKPTPRLAPGSSGFPRLEELCLATTSYSFIDDGVLQRILWASRSLRVLDLRGCFRVTPKGVEQLPCPDLEQLYLGLYCSTSNLLLPLEGSPLITWKWNHSLRELDLTGQRFSEQDLEQAMTAFTQGGAPVLSSLNLTGTKVVLRTVSAIIASCSTLSYLNLSSCRHLPRGTKKAYRGPDEIRQCLHQLLTNSEEPAELEEAT